MKVAVSGKGGVGKTLIAGSLASFFAGKGLKVIAIDADPSPNLALTLGLSAEEVRKIVPISENTELVSRKTETDYSGVYRLSFTVDDVVKEHAVATPRGVYLVVMGTVKSMGSGCTCPANAVVRALLRHLIVERDEIVLLDMEAGVEHLGRGTAKHVDVMLIVADPSLKSLETARHIHSLASNAGIKRILLIGNKIATEAQKNAIDKYAHSSGLSLLGHVPFDEKVMEADIEGTLPLNRQGSVAVQTIEELGTRLWQLAQGAGSP